MKKNILKVTLVAAFALIARFNVYSSYKSDVMSDLALANVEALASGEGAAGDPCYKGSYDSTKPEATKCAHPCVKERCGGLTDRCY